MDKITRILLLYSKLIRGEPVNKVSFCMETESNERSFDRDVEDVRLYLAESFSTEEVIYNRVNNCYVLSGVVKQDLEMTEYRFLERLIIQSGMLRKDELVGLLSILALNTTKSSECLGGIDLHTKEYPERVFAPLLKMHDDIVSMIANKVVIEIRYHDRTDVVNTYTVVPYDIQFAEGRMYLIAFEADSESNVTKYYLIEKIESFERKRKVSSHDMLRIEGMKVETKPLVKTKNVLIELACNHKFADVLKKQYKDAVTFLNNGQVSVWCDAEKFIRWIVGQEVADYEIISPEEIKEEIGNHVIKLYDKFGKGIDYGKEGKISS